MPVYGKGRANRSVAKRNIIPQSITEWERSPIRRTKGAPHYHYTNTPRARVSKNLGFAIGDWIRKKWRRERRPLVVIDWGCGEGTAIDEIARQYGEKVHAYGYSIDSYPSWEKNERVKFIWQDPYRFLRYFKPGTADIIYSHYGLFHFEKYLYNVVERSNTETEGVQEYADYLRQLGQRLRVGGIIVAHTHHDVARQLKKIQWQEKGLVLHTRSNPTTNTLTLRLERIA